MTVTKIAGKDYYAPKSVLAEGKWVKISITETGFYKLTFAELRKMGFVSPEKVSIHGYGGYPLDEDFGSTDYKDDLPSIPVYRGSDYLLFYGKGTVKWHYNADKKLFNHENNAYTTKGYYFVTDATEIDDVIITPSISGTSLTIDKYDDYMVHEVDRVSLTNAGRPNSGRELFGESFDATNTRDFPFNVPGITNDDGTVSFRFVAKIKSGTGIVTLSADDVELSRGSIYQDTYIYTAALSHYSEAVWKGDKNEQVNIRVSFSMTGETSNLDFIRLQMKRRLQPYEACTPFRSIESINQSTQFVIGNATQNTLVFDVTDRMTQMETSLDGNNAIFSIPAGSLREFAIADLSKTFPIPEIIGEVAVQNLHGLPQTKMIIVAPSPFISEAERLAAFHRRYDNLSVAIVTPEQIYNEFASGGQEATAIRRFMKMFYDRRTSDEDAPEYLLLFGDGRWDNRKLSDVWRNSSDNYIVTYETRESIAENSYVTDDYFGFLEDGEGSNIVSATMNIAVGRFPVNTLQQAKIAVNKVISYVESSKVGAWKNSICFLADDGNRNDSDPTIHALQSDSLAKYIENAHPNFLPLKLYFDAFKINYTGGKPTYPDIRANLQKAFRDGILILNYTGHGDAVSMSEEKVITQADIINYTHKNLPLWITSTCDFAPFDAPATSAGEDVFLNPNSGGIALMTTSRVAYSDANFRMHKLLLENLFNKQDDGTHLTIGTAFKNAKNGFRSELTMCYLLIGDPAMRLNYPDDFKMEVTEINGKHSDDQPINISAYEKVNIKGRIINGSGAVINDFNGTMTAKVYDGQRQIETLNNAGGGSIIYNDYPNMLYSGSETVNGGAFTFSFTVPVDISYTNNFGKISLYASDETNNIEANGYFKNYTVGGTADVPNNDNDGPEIRSLYLNTTDFIEGDKVNTTPVFAAVVWDESGINAGGSSIGHDIMLVIDNNPSLSYSLNSYYDTYLEGNAGEGIIRFPIPELETGKHTAEFKVWDIMNNSSSQVFSFNVVDNYKPEIIELTAAPSPAIESVSFLIKHDRPESLITVEIQVVDIAGRLEWRHVETGSSEMFESYRISWNLTNGAGARLRPGIYFYRAIIRNGKINETSKSNKLIIAQ